MKTRTAKTPLEPGDAEVISQVLLGNTELFAVLFDRYSKKVFGYLWHFAGRREDCEDFLQDTFYRAYVNLKYCREKEKFSSWLFSIAHNVAVSGSKRLSLQYTRELLDDNSVHLENAVASDDLNLQLVRQENAELLNSIISLMPPKYREAVILFYYNDMGLKEISDTLDVPVNTVKTRLHRARQYIGDKLREPPNKEEFPVANLETNNNHIS